MHLKTYRMILKTILSLTGSQWSDEKLIFKSLLKAEADGTSLMILGYSFNAYAAAMLEVLSSNGSSFSTNAKKSLVLAELKEGW